MWHDASEATNASSGSTTAASDIGTGTTAGELEAGTTARRSKAHWWAREYLLSVKRASPRCQETVAVYSCLLMAGPRKGAPVCPSAVQLPLPGTWPTVLGTLPRGAAMKC